MRSWLIILTLVAGAVQARVDQVQIHGNAAGTQTLTQPEPGVTAADYRFNDRGRGDVIQARWRLDARGLPVSYEAQGNDYWKVEFSERFARDAQGLALWKNRIESGESRAAGFYLPANPPPEFMGVLARALLKAPGRRLQLLPAGEAWLEQGVTQGRLTLYRISGIEFTPVSVWLDGQGETAGVIDDWFEVLQASDLPELGRLQAAQQAADQAWHARLAQQHTHRPKGALLIRNARLFDPVSLSVRPGSSVLIRGERIVRVGPDAEVEAPADAELLDAAGRFLMPGLWDVHQHFSNVDGVFDLIAGVTSARDMANDNEPMLARVKRFDAGTELGPRVLLAGIIEGIGPLAGPTDVKVDTPEKARAAVDWYADRGYVQVKIYSSFSPALVATVADRAHERGLRVSGHVPAFTYARAFVEAGADEIQHLNFILLNFFANEVKDTRTRDRYTVLAEKLAQFNFDDGRKAEFSEFVTFLRQHQTVLDPTMVVLEGLFSGEPARAAPALRPVVQRFPTVVKRRQLSGAVAVPAGKQGLYAQALPGLLRMLKRLHDGGVTIMPGSDGFSGYSLHRELELYARAGIANAEVLRIATLTPARVLGVEKDRGTITAGKLADMILVDGDPLADMGDIRRVHRTIKGGRVYDPAALEQAMGMSPR